MANKHLHDKLRNESPLPDHLQWDKMNDGIYAKMNYSQQNDKLTNIRSSLLLLFIFFLLLCCISGFYINQGYFSNNKILVEEKQISNPAKNSTLNEHNSVNRKVLSTNSSDIIVYEKTNTVIEEPKKNGDNIPSQHTQNIIESVVADAKTSSVNIDNGYSSIQSLYSNENYDTKTPLNSELESVNTEKTVNFVNENAIRSNKNEADNLAYKNKSFNEKISYQLAINNQNSQQDQHVLESIQISENNLASNQGNEKNLISKKLEMEALVVEEQLDNYSINISNLDKLNLLEIQKDFKVIDFPFSDPIIIAKDNNDSKLSLSIQTGIAAMQSNYSGTDLSEAKSNIESEVIGKSLKLRLTYRLNQSISIQTGISYLSLTQKLDYYDEKDTLINRNVERQFRNVYTDLITESQNSVLIPATKWHKVIHYNRTNLVNIPLIISKHFTVSHKADVQLGIGAYFTLSGNSKGRTLGLSQLDDQDFEVIDFDNNLYDFPSKLGWIMSSSFLYKLTPKMSIGIGLETTKFVQNLSLTEGEQFSPFIFDGSFQLNYRF